MSYQTADAFVGDLNPVWVSSGSNSKWKLTSVWKKFYSVQVSIHEAIKMKCGGTLLVKSASVLFSNSVELETVTILLLTVAYSSNLPFDYSFLKNYLKKKGKQQNSPFPGRRNAYFPKHLMVSEWDRRNSVLSSISHITGTDVQRNWPSDFASEGHQNCRDSGLGFVPVPISP